MTDSVSIVLVVFVAALVFAHKVLYFSGLHYKDVMNWIHLIPRSAYSDPDSKLPFGLLANMLSTLFVIVGLALPLSNDPEDLDATLVIIAYLLVAVIPDIGSVYSFFYKTSLSPAIIIAWVTIVLVMISTIALFQIGQWGGGGSLLLAAMLRVPEVYVFHKYPFPGLSHPMGQGEESNPP